MPEKRTLLRAKQDARAGKHDVRSKKQAVAIGLSKARKAGIPVPPQGRKAAHKTESRKPAATPSHRRATGLSRIRAAARKAARMDRAA